jgi:predicted RNase H-like nuclease
MSIHVIGVDAHALGWVAVELRDGAFVRAMISTTLYDIVTNSSGAAMIGIDVPLGMLPDHWRAADTLAADHVGPRRGSIFRVPPQPVWQETTFAAATALCREITGAKMHQQAWAIRPKLLEANAIGDRHPGLLIEARPELSFRAMAGEPLEHAKKTWTGQAIRRTLLAREGITVPARIGPAGRVPPDDILDAAAVAWSAHRVATGTALSHPSPPEEHAGSKIAIWH